MMPISVLRGVARQARVGVERDAVAHRRQDVAARRPASMKLVSVAPRSSRLNSSILPRLRSQPIHACSRAFQRRSRWNRKKRSAWSAPNRRLSVLDAGARARRESRRRPGSSRRVGVGEVAEDREVDVRIEVAEREHLDVLEQRRRPPSTLVSSVGTTTIVRASSGTPSEKSRRGRRRGGIAQAIDALHERDRDVGRRDQQQQHQRGQRAPRRGAARARRTRQPPTSSAPSRARSRRGRRASRERRRSRLSRAGEPRPVGEVGLEIAAPAIDEVIADVGGAIGRRSGGGRLPRALDRPAARPAPALRRSAPPAPRPPAAGDRG